MMIRLECVRVDFVRELSSGSVGCTASAREGAHTHTHIYNVSMYVCIQGHMRVVRMRISWVSSGCACEERREEHPAGGWWSRS